MDAHEAFSRMEKRLCRVSMMTGRDRETIFYNNDHRPFFYSSIFVTVLSSKAPVFTLSEHFFGFVYLSVKLYR